MDNVKRAQIIILPTENETSIILNPTTNYLSLTKSIGFTIYPIKEYIELGFKPQHLYIISDDEIKEGDWYLNSLNSHTIHCHFNGEKLPNYGVRKIIASTESSITNYSIKSNPNSGISTYIKELPKPSQQFIEKYIQAYNKGEVITDVLVEYEWIDCLYHIEKTTRKKVVKTNYKDNTITIKKLKDSWNKEEIVELINKYSSDIINIVNTETFRKNWIKENL